MKANPEYPVLNLKASDGTDGTEILGLGPEQLGSKKKIWLLLEDAPECPWLFKYNRPGSSFPERQGELVHGNGLLSVRLPQYQKRPKWDRMRIINTSYKRKS